MFHWKKTFVSAFVAQILSIVGFSFCLPFLPFFIQELGITGKGDQAWWAGIVMSASGVTLALFAPIWGILADRYGRRIMVMRAMFCGTLVLVLMSFVQTVGQLVACRLLQGAITGTVAASVALVASVTPSNRSGFTLGMMQTAVLIGMAAGPLVGGVLADHVGYRTTFRFGGVMLFLGGLLVRYGTSEPFTPLERDRGERPQGFKTIFMATGFAAAVLVLFSIRFSTTLSYPSFPLIVKEILGGTQRLNSITGSIVCTAAVTGAISAALLGHFGDSWGHKRVLMACSLGTAATSFAHAFAHSMSYLYVVRALFGLAVAGMIPSANAIIRHTIDDNHIGKAFGAATALSVTGFAVGPLLGGYIAKTLGLRAPFVVMGIGQLAVLAVVALLIPDRGSPCDPTEPGTAEA